MVRDFYVSEILVGFLVVSCGEYVDLGELFQYSATMSVFKPRSEEI